MFVFEIGTFSITDLQSTKPALTNFQGTSPSHNLPDTSTTMYNNKHHRTTSEIGNVYAIRYSTKWVQFFGKLLCTVVLYFMNLKEK